MPQIGSVKQIRQNPGVWYEAMVHYKLSDTHLTMAAELNLNPKKFPSYAPSKSQPWKKPLSEFIEGIYQK